MNNLHVGFMTRNLELWEISNKAIYIPREDRTMFPNVHVLFFVDSYGKTYGGHLTEEGYITGLETWFKDHPLQEGDIIIISKYAEGYHLTTSSEIVNQDIKEKEEKERVSQLTDEDILCPNCQYALEWARSTIENYVLKCARCGFSLVRKHKQKNNVV